MIVTWVSKKGGRKINEDAVGKSRKKGVTCVVVADGLGGHSGGKIASTLSVETILGTFEKEPGFSKEHIEKYINAANEVIVEKAMNNPELLHMSSTLVVLLVKGRKAIWANVGDSRIYKFQNGEITDVSEDHSLAFLDFVRGSIEYDEIRTSENQNKLTSAVGVSMDGINVSDIISVDTSSNFLLCTDGWWEYVNEDTMEQTYKKASSARQWLQQMMKVREENAPDDSDNFTAALLAL